MKLDNTIGNLSDNDCRAIWAIIPTVAYDWPVKKAARSRLASLLGEPETSLRIQTICDPRSARLLREAVGPLLRSTDKFLRTEAAKWIVADWGGIRRGEEELEIWLAVLGSFDRQSVLNFVAELERRRIASWSKLLSFALPDTYAIYDARTAFTLNAAIHLAGKTAFFFKPAGRNRAVESSAQALLKVHGQGSLDYFAYMDLLDRFHNLGLAESILQAEQIIFAAAPTMTSRVSGGIQAYGKHQHPLARASKGLPRWTSALLAEEAFQMLDASQRDAVLELIPDVFGGQNERSPAAISRGMKKIEKAINLEMQPALRASLLKAIDAGAD
ncbi:MAG: hypothetical protein O9248_00775 [Rhodobacteraceae bacterium]|nr:hypothetical protein [Paracoccaceae bacterium]